MIKILEFFLITVLGLLALTGCQSNETGAAPNPQGDYPNPPRQEDGLPIELDKITSNLVTLAKDDLASRLNVSADVIQLTQLSAVEWPDPSLGLPADDMMYAQVITPGYILEFETNNTTYVYHTDQERVVFAGEK